MHLSLIPMTNKSHVRWIFAKDVCVFTLKRSVKLILILVIVFACFWLTVLYHRALKSSITGTISTTTAKTLIKPIPIPYPKKPPNENFPAVHGSKNSSFGNVNGDVFTRKFEPKENYPNYYEDNSYSHSHWAFKISRTYDKKHLHHWTEPNRIVSESQQWRQGENGTRFVPANSSEAAIAQKLLNEYKYNLYASEQISVRRSLPDYRFEECRQLTYPKLLPNVSVIIVMHNEAWTIVLRTIWSIIDRSPPELLHEIIVVDDASTWKFLKRPLDDYFELLSTRVRILRTTQREGLVRARLIGANNATGSILVFLDAHSECTKGWLEPIAARIANDRSVVAVPLIDGISSNDMGYDASSSLRIHVLRWHLIFTSVAIPERELLRTKNDPTAPIRTPTHIGCAFAIDREFFFEIGSYDTKMDIWGSENVELAFRVWMCGGSLEILPCSRVGHLYRISTYSFGDGDRGQIITRNNVRMVEVWMDEFKELFYASNVYSQNFSPGDLSARKQLRKELKCKNFRWYLENVYPESTWLKEYTDMGEIRSVSMSMCLDIDSTAIDRKLKLWPCHGYGGKQFFAFEKSSGQIVTVEEHCVGVNLLNEVILVHCSDTDNTQRWTFDRKRHWLVHRQSNLCMQNNERSVVLGACNSEQSLWSFKSTMRPKLMSNIYSTMETIAMELN